ncbi:hypothetical protein Plhal304r1_c009g0035901 [Plasmopara halstedii]
MRFLPSLENGRPMQQRAAAAAQALLPGRTISQQEIQAMLEKNEAALKGWTALHKQQPAKTSPVEHKEWVRRCLTFRQHVGARLEVLASLADKQIAQEDDKKLGHRVSLNAATTRQVGKTQGSNTTFSQQQSMPESQQPFLLPQDSAMASSVPLAMTTATLIEPPTVLTSVSTAMPNMAAATMFPEPPLPTVGLSSSNPNMFFPTEPIHPLQTSSGFGPTTSISGAASTVDYPMSSGAQTFTSNTCMTAFSEPLSSSASYMNPPNYLMGGSMIPSQQFIPMSMPINSAVSGSENLFANNNYSMASASNSVNTEIGNNNSSTNNFAMNPFMTPFGFGPEASFQSAEISIGNIPSMSIEQQQAINSLNGCNLGAQGAPMMQTSYEYGGMSQPSNIMPQAMPDQALQPTPHPYHQQRQLSQQHHPVGFMSMTPDSAIYGDCNVNIFEGLTDDVFFPMQ